MMRNIQRVAANMPMQRSLFEQALSEEDDNTGDNISVRTTEEGDVTSPVTEAVTEDATPPHNLMGCYAFYIDRINRVNDECQMKINNCSASYETLLQQIMDDNLVLKRQYDSDLNIVSQDLNGCSSIEDIVPGYNCQINTKSIVSQITAISNKADQSKRQMDSNSVQARTDRTTCTTSATSEAKQNMDTEYAAMAICAQYM